MRRKHILLICFFIGILNQAWSQFDLKRMNIMVTPYTKEGQDIRNILEENPMMRITISEINNFFIENGYSVLDYIARLKKAKQDGLFKSLDNGNVSAKEKFLEYTGPDIYLEVEPTYIESASGNSISLRIQSYHKATSLLLASVVCHSSKFYTDNIGGLISRALRECEKELVQAMHNGFETMRIDGQALQIHFNIPDGTVLVFDDEFKDDDMGTAPLSDLIEFWISEHEWINYYNYRGKVQSSLIYDSVRVKFEDSNGKYIPPSKVILQLKKYLRNLAPGKIEKGGGLAPTDSRINNTWYITISQRP